MLCRWRRVVDIVDDCVASELCDFTSFGWGMVVLTTLVFDIIVDAIAFGVALLFSFVSVILIEWFLQAFFTIWSDNGNGNGAADIWLGSNARWANETFVCIIWLSVESCGSLSLMRICGVADFESRKRLQRSMKLCDTFDVSSEPKWRPCGNGSDDDKFDGNKSANSSSSDWRRLYETIDSFSLTSLSNFCRQVHESGRSLVAMSEIPFDRRSLVEK